MRIIGLTLIVIIFLISCHEIKTETFDMSSLPTEWVRLTERNGKLIVFNSCDAGNLLLTISKRENKFELLLHGEQENYEFEILKSDEFNDTIVFKAKWKDSDEIQDFKFHWTDREKGLGRWTTTYSNGFFSDNIFVIKEKEKDFEQVQQPCKECWGDECDEIKSSIELMQGNWYHDQDSLATLIIENNNWKFNYDNRQANVRHEDYLISFTDKLPEFVDKTEKSEFVILIANTDTLYYEILGLNDTSFSLMNFPSGRIHLYRRTK